MPKFRTTEAPEQSSSGFLGLAIVAALLALMALLLLRGDLKESRQAQVRVFVPKADQPPQG